MFITINLLVATAIQLHSGTPYSTDEYRRFATAGYENQKSIDKEDTTNANTRTDISVDETSLLFKIGKFFRALWFFTTNALNPFSIPPSDYTNTIENMLVSVLAYLRCFIGFIIVIEVWSYFRNKKQP